MYLKSKKKGEEDMVLNKIKTLCNENKISIAELERNLGFGNGSIRRWSTSNPSINNLNKVAEYFGLSIQYFLDSEIQLSKEALDLAKEYENLSSKQKELVKLYISVI